MLKMIIFSILLSVHLSFAQEVNEIKTSKGMHNFTLTNYDFNGKLYFLLGYPGTIHVYDSQTKTVSSVLPKKFNGKSGNFDISRDGKTLVFSALVRNSWNIYSASLNKRVRVNSLIERPFRDEDPRLSFDGNEIVYKSDNDIQLNDAVASSHHAKVVMKPNDYLENHYDFFIEDTNSTNGTTVNGQVVRSIEEEWAPSFSPDGRYVAFGRGTDHDANLGQIMLHDRYRGLTTFVTSQYHNWFPVFRENGDLLFISKRDPLCDDDIYLIPRDSLLYGNPESDLQRLSMSKCSNSSQADPWPVYSRDSEMTYLTNWDGPYSVRLHNFTTLEDHFLISHDSESILGPILLGY